jgi:diguanylate cyclase (GGDEF)-like protein
MAKSKPKTTTKVLIVNAPSRSAKALDQQLKKTGFETFHSWGSATLLKTIGVCTPDIVLIYYTPAWAKNNKGWNTLKKLKKSHKLPVLLSLDKRDKKVLSEKKNTLYDDFILRPLDSVELAARLNSITDIANTLAGTSDERDRAENILDITRAVFSTLNISDILETIVTKLTKTLDAKDCSIVRVETEGSEFFVLESFEKLSTKNLKLDMNLHPEIQMVLETRYPLSIEDISTHPLMNDVRSSVKELKDTHALIIPIVFEDPVLGTMFIRAKRKGKPFTQRDVRLAGLVANASFFAIKNSRLYEIERHEKDRLKNISITDPLTTLYNHNHFYLRLNEELNRSQRYKIPLSLIMMDIDDFKKINDTHGHRFGDVVLKSVANILKGCVRKADIVARYGGEEFAVILPFTPLKGALYEAERIRELIEGHPFIPDTDEKITMSLGVAILDDENIKDSGDMVNLADKALYMAKKAGKNKVVSATSVKKTKKKK